MKRFKLVVTMALFAAACSQGGGPEDSTDVAEAPNISPTAAPGVAFRYFYAFELPDEAISAVQEKHAARCESLGPARCRITGLEYSVDPDNAVAASLTVKLAPEIARQFGKAATGDVSDAEGQLRRTEFTGDDTEPATTEAGRQQSDAATRIGDVERQLAASSSGVERAQLQSQLNELQSQLSQSQAVIAGAKARLASTPMTFNYYGRGGISGFRTNPVREAARLFVSSVVTMVSFLLKLIAVALPWALLIAMLIYLARTRYGRAVGRFLAPRRDESE